MICRCWNICLQHDKRNSKIIRQLWREHQQYQYGSFLFVRIKLKVLSHLTLVSVHICCEHECLYVFMHKFGLVRFSCNNNNNNNLRIMLQTNDMFAMEYKHFLHYMFVDMTGIHTHTSICDEYRHC